jgi:hypothetical protein
MTNADPRSDKTRKVEPPSPETLLLGVTYDRELDAYNSWLLAVDELHDRMVAELVADHDPRMPEDWIP